MLQTEPQEQFVCNVLLPGPSVTHGAMMGAVDTASFCCQERLGLNLSATSIVKKPKVPLWMDDGAAGRRTGYGYPSGAGSLAPEEAHVAAGRHSRILTES